MIMETRPVSVETAVEAFTKSLTALQPGKQSSDRKALAELRGILHDQPRDFLRAGKYVFGYLPDIDNLPQEERDYIETCFFTIGGLYAWGYRSISSKPGVSLGAALRGLRNPDTTNDSMDNRFLALLNSQSDTFFVQLRQMVALLASSNKNDVPIQLDWSLLLKDAIKWNQGDKHIQKRWAKHYYTFLPRESKETEIEASEAEALESDESSE